MQFLRATHLNFIGYRKYGYIFSSALILIGLLSLALHKGPKLSIDFTGGTSLQLKFEKPIDAGELRNSLSDIGFGDAEIKRIGLPLDAEFIIRVEKMEEEGAEVALILEE